MHHLVLVALRPLPVGLGAVQGGVKRLAIYIFVGYNRHDNGG